MTEELKFTPEQLAQMEKMMNETLPSIQEMMKANILRRVEWNVGAKVDAMLDAFVAKWVTENIFPEVEKALIERKEGLVSVAGNIATECCVAIQGVLLDALKENIKTNYSRNTLIKTLFG